MNITMFRKKSLALALSLLMVFTLFAVLGAPAAYGATPAGSIGPVTNLGYLHRDDDSVDLIWDRVDGASGYEVERYVSSSGSWKVIGRTSRDTFEADDLASATVYQFRVRAYAEDASGVRTYGGYDTYRTCTKPNDVDNLRVSDKTTSTVTLRWNAVARADKYQVYRYNSATKTWKRLITTSKTYYKDTNLKSNTTYKYRVRAYRKVNDGKLNSTYYSEYENISAKTAKKATSSSSSSSSGGMTMTKAKNIALKDAGYSASQVDFVKEALDRDDGITVYEIEFYVGDYEYDYTIHASTGRILEKDRDYRWD